MVAVKKACVGGEKFVKNEITAGSQVWCDVRWSGVVTPIHLRESGTARQRWSE